MVQPYTSGDLHRLRLNTLNRWKYHRVWHGIEGIHRSEIIGDLHGLWCETRDRRNWNKKRVWRGRSVVELVLLELGRGEEADDDCVHENVKVRRS